MGQGDDSAGKSTCLYKYDNPCSSKYLQSKKKPDVVLYICYPSSLTVMRWEVETEEANEPGSLAYTQVEPRDPDLAKKIRTDSQKLFSDLYV